MLGKWRRIHNGCISLSTSSANLGSEKHPFVDRLTGEENSPRSNGTIPVPITTPKRVGSTMESTFKPASSIAIFDAAMPNCTLRPITFRLLRLPFRNGAASHRLISPPTLTVWPEASNESTKEMPDLPCLVESQNPLFPIPFGATMPSPVTTTRRMTIELRICGSQPGGLLKKRVNYLPKPSGSDASASVPRVPCKYTEAPFLLV